MGAVANDRMLRLSELIESAVTLPELSQRVSEGESLQAICKAWDVPYGRVMVWLMADAERYGVYERALEVAAHALIAETLELADSAEETKGAISKATLQVNTRFRVAKHHAPAKYGEQQEQGAVTNVQINIGVRGKAQEKMVGDRQHTEEDRGV